MFNYKNNLEYETNRIITNHVNKSMLLMNIFFKIEIKIDIKLLKNVIVVLFLNLVKWFLIKEFIEIN